MSASALAAIFVSVFAASFGLSVLSGMWLRKRAPAPQRPLEAGDRVRFLIAIPELGIEAGEEGRIYMIYPGDDLQYFVAPDHDTSKRAIFFENELWQIERAP